MALVELQHGQCERCGHGILLHVYWPYATVLRRLIATGGLPGFDDDDLEAMLADVLSVDEHEQDGPDGNVSMVGAFAAATGGVFVDGRRQQVVTCPLCGAVVGILAKPKMG